MAIPVRWYQFTEEINNFNNLTTINYCAYFITVLYSLLNNTN